MNNVIKINIKKKEDYVSKYNDNILSRELSNYILEEYRSFNINENFSLEINSQYNINDYEKDKIIDMIRENYGLEISELKEKRKKAIYIDIITALIASVGLIFYVLSSEIPIISEFILIFCWVLMGESVYNIVYDGFSNRIDIIRRKKLTECKIIFKEKDQE